MSTKRMRENLEYLLSIEEELTSQGKRPSAALCAAKRYAQTALQQAV